ncbi:MAG: hypothetical protein FWG64_09095 [Firmicutes bacterium]|nr:hypothetical protein [Bacillota bacterium]
MHKKHKRKKHKKQPKPTKLVHSIAIDEYDWQRARTQAENRLLNLLKNPPIKALETNITEEPTETTQTEQNNLENILEIKSTTCKNPRCGGRRRSYCNTQQKEYCQDRQ